MAFSSLPSCASCMTAMAGWFGFIDIGVGVFIAASGVNELMGLGGGKFLFDSAFIGVALTVAGTVVALLSLANCVSVSRYFLFVNRFWGRGGLYIFLGVLCINSTFWRILFGGLTIATGIVYMLYSCALPNAKPQPLTGCTLCDTVDAPDAPTAAAPKASQAGPFAAEAESGAPKSSQPFREAGAGTASVSVTTRRAGQPNPDNPFSGQAQGRSPFDSV